MSSPELNLPDTSNPPDRVDFDGQMISWDFEFDGKKASLTHVRPGFNDFFHVARGGERITLHGPEEGAKFDIVELDGPRKNSWGRRHTLAEDGETTFVPGGRNMRVWTGTKAVELVRIYPRQAAEAEE